MVQRVRTMMAYIYDNFLDDYDYFHFGGEDVFMMVENMKEFLASDKVQQWEQEEEDKYLMAGFWANHHDFFPKGQFYLAGGSGYTLSRKALKTYVEGPLQVCDSEGNGAMEDVYFAQCVREHISNETFIDTRDEAGAHRYHANSLQAHSLLPDTIVDNYMMAHIQSMYHLETAFGFPNVHKEAYISNSSVTFHR
jgi:glycoprotein-N-acetylgalactosamine 3-beta-galactosyltransferase